MAPPVPLGPPSRTRQRLIGGVLGVGMVERLLGDLKPRYTREFDVLAVAWPEMAGFLGAHGLASPQP